MQIDKAILECAYIWPCNYAAKLYELCLIPEYQHILTTTDLAIPVRPAIVRSEVLSHLWLLVKLYRYSPYMTNLPLGQYEAYSFRSMRDEHWWLRDDEDIGQNWIAFVIKISSSKLFVGYYIVQTPIQWPLKTNETKSKMDFSKPRCKSGQFDRCELPTILTHKFTYSLNRSKTREKLTINTNTIRSTADGIL